MSNDISKKKAKSSSEKKAKRKTKRKETYAMYIYKVLKQVGERSSVFLPFFLKKILNFFFKKLIHIRFPCASAGPPGHGHLEPSHEHHELVRERPVRADRHRGVPADPVQQALHHHQPGGADRSEAAAARRAGQTRRVRGHQGGHQVHQLQVKKKQKQKRPCKKKKMFIVINAKKKKTTLNESSGLFYLLESVMCPYNH